MSAEDLFPPETKEGARRMEEIKKAGEKDVFSFKIRTKADGGVNINIDVDSDLEKVPDVLSTLTEALKKAFTTKRTGAGEKVS